MRTRVLMQLLRHARPYMSGSIIEQVERALGAAADRGDPAVQRERQLAKLERRRVRAGRWLTAWVLITLIGAIIAVFAFTGIIQGDTATAALSGIIMSLIAGTMAVRSVLRIRLIRHAQRELGGYGSRAPRRRGLPPSGSLAREPMQRLAEAESTLHELLRQLSGRPGEISAVPPESIEQARTTGADAAAALRAVAVQLIAVERARDHAPQLERGSLAEGVRRLRAQLDEGLEGYRGLIAAAGRVLAASSPAGPGQELADATDHLAGVAVALRELSQD